MTGVLSTIKCAFFIVQLQSTQKVAGNYSITTQCQKNLYYIRDIMSIHVTSGGACLRVLEPTKHSFEESALIILKKAMFSCNTGYINEVFKPQGEYSSDIMISGTYVVS